MQIEQLIQAIAIAAIPILFAITLHEAAHGYVARHFGDMTAYQQGRISLNPIRHIDLVGTILLPLLTLWMGGILFGWAKPVPVNFAALNRPKQDMLWVALAGPAANLLMAITWAIGLRILFESGERTGFWFEMCQAGIHINLVLMALNLLPILPLDGGRVLFSLLPNRLAWQYGRMEPYGMWIVIALLATGMLTTLISPIVGVGEWLVRLFL